MIRIVRKTVRRRRISQSWRCRSLLGILQGLLPTLKNSQDRSSSPPSAGDYRAGHLLTGVGDTLLQSWCCPPGLHQPQLILREIHARLTPNLGRITWRRCSSRLPSSVSSVSNIIVCNSEWKFNGPHVRSNQGISVNYQTNLVQFSVQI